MFAVNVLLTILGLIMLVGGAYGILGCFIGKLGKFNDTNIIIPIVIIVIGFVLVVIH